jgi:hypothetical protein
MSREEDILYDFIESDRIWPPIFMADMKHVFVRALTDVLVRIPDEVYDMVTNRVNFVVEDPRIHAINVPFSRYCPPSAEGHYVQFETIVVFHQLLAYPFNALVGALAHEIAHSFVSGEDFRSDEEKVDALVLEWGFRKELEAAHVQMNRK